MSGRSYFCILITHVIAVITVGVSKGCEPDLITSECKFLYENVVQYLDGNPCNNFYSYTCGRQVANIQNLLNRVKHLPNLPEIEKDLLDFLDRPEYRKIVSTEKDLYDQCLKLGTAEDDAYRTPSNYANYFSLFALHKQIINNDTWQYIDKRVSDLGFGHAFFDVKIVQNPNDLDKNIIVVEPPPISRLNSTYQILKAIFKDSTIDSYSTLKNVNDYVYLFEYIKRVLKDPIDQFFDSWIDAIDEVSQSTYIQFPNKNTTIKQWNHDFNVRYYASDTNKILWDDILITMFNDAGVIIDNDEQIIVKNEPYFTKMFYILGNTPNNITGMSVILKAVTEHLKYVDWNFAQNFLINKDDKTSFCLKETKLYGPSYKLLFDFKEKKDVDKPSAERILEIVRHIDKALRYKIYDNSLLYKVKRYLLAELDKITHNLLKNTWDTTSISNIYGQYKISTTYLDSIISYRKMLKNKEFSLLRDDSKLLSRMPFSATDLNNPGNRFNSACVMNVLSLTRTLDQVLSHTNEHEPFLKEYYYGHYGTKLSSFLYGLLNENKFEDPYRYEDILTDAHPEFSHNVMQCLITRFDDFKKLFGTTAIMQLYGLQVAYDAMHHSYFDDDKSATNIAFTQKNITSVDQFFFLTYSRSVCDDQYSRVVNIAVSNVEHFIYEFGCDKVNNYNKLKCTRKAFEEPNNRIYLLQLY